MKHGRSRHLMNAIVVLSLLGGSAAASFTPVDFAVRDATSVHAVLFAEGAFFAREDQAAFSCASEYGPAEAVVWTGRAKHGVVVGEDGPWLSTEEGCHWRRTTGAADGKRIVGHFQSEEGSERVVFAVDDAFGGTNIVETLDGGFTSDLSGSLAVADAHFIGLAGEGSVAVLLGLSEENALRAWWSEDGGAVFLPAEDPGLIVSGEMRVAGYASERVWFWDGATLRSLGASGELEAESLDVSPGGSIASLDGEVLWLAAGADGLWRRGPGGGWEKTQSESTTSVKAAYGTLWIARPVAHAGMPVILRSHDQGESWWPAWNAPSQWSYPAACASSLGQLCAEANDAVRRSLGLRVGESMEALSPDPAPVETGCQASKGRVAAWGPAYVLLLLWYALLRRRSSLGFGVRLDNQEGSF